MPGRILPGTFIKVYPIPAFSTVTIELLPEIPVKNTILAISNISGLQILRRKITEKKTVIDVSGWPQGIYFIRISTDRLVQVKKIIKN